MSKEVIINEIAERAGISKAAAKTALQATTDAIASELQKGNRVQLIGFGTFEVRERAARTGKNPQTGEAIQIAAAKVAAFKQGKALKESLN